MTRIRCIIGVLIASVFTADASAQIVVGLPFAIPGVGFRYKSGGLRIGGFVPTGPYFPYAPYYPYPPFGMVQQRINVQMLAPPPVVIVRRPSLDLSGIDLDVEPASRIWGEKPTLAKKSEPVGEPARIVPPPEKAPPPLPPAAPPPAKPERVPESRRLTDLGVEAFRNGEYNLAIRHFRQLADLSPLIARPLFLEGQALIAVGKYREAVEIIERGLQRHPEWPSSGFRPKADLYDNDEAIWTAQRKQIEEAHRRNPKNADYRFLLGYLAWFDGQREAAVEHFQEARAVAADARWCDLFLKAAKK